jgi:hypothetical protein
MKKRFICQQIQLSVLVQDRQANYGTVDGIWQSRRSEWIRVAVSESIHYGVQYYLKTVRNDVALQSADFIFPFSFFLLHS